MGTFFVSASRGVTHLGDALRLLRGKSVRFFTAVAYADAEKNVNEIHKIRSLF